MSWQDMFGHMHDGSPPEYDNTNGQHYDTQAPRIRRPNGTGWWMTRELIPIRISAMSDRHLENSIKMLERTARRKAMRLSLDAMRYASRAPEMAAEAAEEASREFMDLEFTKEPDSYVAERVWEKYGELTAERDNRRNYDLLKANIDPVRT